MATIYIDHQSYEVPAGKNLLETCLTLGINLPYFCWHPAMGSVGACRQCAVKLFKDETDSKGRLVMSCMEAVKDKMYLSVNDPTAKAFRAEVIEWLMTNHPHDCAVCDEGGSCHLQDMTVMTGHTYRRFQYKKRSYRNQYLGPFINHEMNRCIQCYRCVRYYKDYAGGKDLDVFAAHHHVYFGRAADGVLESEFSGNLVEVCPTGVFTDKSLKEHYTRKWDMTMAPSICQHCSLGCNIIGGERYGELRQITNRFNEAVNGYFICDRGRFGYEFVNSINRVQKPLIRAHVPDATDKRGLFIHLRNVLLDTKLMGIGSPRASLESNFALMQLVGKENFYQGVPEMEAGLIDRIIGVLNSNQVHTPSLKEMENADAVLILGEDVTNSAPVMALSLRQAVNKKPFSKAQQIGVPTWHDAALREYAQQERGPLFILHPMATKLDEIALGNLHLPPDDIARMGFAIAHELNNSAPAPAGLSEDLMKMVQQIAEVLSVAERPLVIAGTSLASQALIDAATNIALALQTAQRKAWLSFVVPECNSMGLAMMGRPGFGKAIEAGAQQQNETVIILENDLYRHLPKVEVDRFLGGFKETIVLDHLHHETTNKASVLIPVGTFAEADGTLINHEGRAQCFFQVFMPKNDNLRESWRWLDEFRQFKNGIALEYLSPPGDLMAELVASMPQFSGAESVAPPADFRMAGQKIPREPHRYSGRTAMFANLNVSEQKPPEDPDSALSFTMEGYKGIPPATLTPFFWAPGWNSVQAVNKYQVEIGGPLKGGPTGKRLFPNAFARETAFLDNIPPAFEAAKGEWLMIPIPHIFGSEELSVYSPGIAARSAKPYIAISRHDAESLVIQENEVLQIQLKSHQPSDSNENQAAFYHQLPVQIKDELPAGVAGLPYQIPGLNGIAWPAKGVLTKAL